MVLGKKTSYQHVLVINSKFVDANGDFNLLGITIDKNLTSSKHIDKFCRTSQFKLHELRQMRKFHSVEKAKLLSNSFIESQLNYATLIWMFCRRTCYSKIAKIHHKTLKVIKTWNKTNNNSIKTVNPIIAFYCKVKVSPYIKGNFTF